MTQKKDGDHFFTMLKDEVVKLIKAVGKLERRVKALEEKYCHECAVGNAVEYACTKCFRRMCADCASGHSLNCSKRKQGK